tara:strand:- start:9885 stop:10454 length:570 start_codon:yes stop_codon:yes gene_type:complete
VALGSALAAGAGCTFDPPGSVVEKNGGADSGVIAADAAVAGETMTITFTSQPTAGLAVPNFAGETGENLVATWIEDSNGAFVQTIDRQLSGFSLYLVDWLAMSGGADTDAVSGATRIDHLTPITATWNIPAEMPNGIYTVRIETADGNAESADQNTQGTFTFEKNGTASTQTPVGEGYTNVTIDYSGAL